MTHLDVESLASDYAEGVLAPAERAAFEAHLSGCSGCRELVAGVRRAIELCRSAEDLEPAPWLVSKILAATLGERKPTLWQRLVQISRPALQPRVAYGIAMAIFSFSLIINAAGLSLRGLKFGDLNPGTWAYRTSREAHLLFGRAEKYYYDLRVVYEIESRLRQLRSEPPSQNAPRPRRPGGGSTDDRLSSNRRLAEVLQPGGFCASGREAVRLGAIDLRSAFE